MKIFENNGNIMEIKIDILSNRLAMVRIGIFV